MQDLARAVCNFANSPHSYAARRGAAPHVDLGVHHSLGELPGYLPQRFRKVGQAFAIGWILYRTRIDLEALARDGHEERKEIARHYATAGLAGQLRR